MADIEMLSRNMAVDVQISGNVTAGAYMFPVWLPIQTFECLAAIAIRASGVGALSAFRVDLADDPAGTVNLTPGPAATAPGLVNVMQEWALIECRASDLYKKSPTGRYCNIFLQAGVGGVPFAAVLIRYNPRYAHPNLCNPTTSAWA